MNQKLILRISAIISGLSGLVILAGVLYPIVSYDSKFSANYDSLISPISGKKEAATIEEVDYTRASNWFVGGAAQEDFVSSKVEYYTISIPKLKIENATVAIGGEDLSKSIIHYPGTALPGKRGNSALFGHSILPIFYNPKDYLSIFSLLPTLKKGDEIFVEYDGISFKYEVETMFEVLPTDLQVLDQDTTDSFLTLVTCVPPGDPRKPKRLIVRARVVPLE
ncbi:MAG: Sortase [Candidatus Woesebacteria bacterium GW2011_GWB1_41_10]|uniref:Sortase n=1 Tax=Candidatus Woesebacteria bacterium GW2011_GWB1_41_10 TaxID=1618577 RepID=A0A0G0WRL8_9BACT|nr:MAG: Sortase [Candidatus Woesebacteria bacterium GW2011_GWB1_41_10]